MQKIEECDSTNDSESHTSHYPIIRISSVIKKSVHFEPNSSKKNSLNDTVDSPSSDNLNIIRQIPSKNDNSKLASTNNGISNLIPLKKRRRTSISTSRYLVCFRKSSNKKEKSEETSEETASKLEVYDNVNSTKEQSKIINTENNTNINNNKKTGSFESNQSTFEFNKSPKDKQISEGFSTNVMRIFRQFNLKNQCCCR